MTCREMDWIITSSSPSSGFPPEAAEHIAECDRCWRLVGILDENCPSSLPSGIQLERIAATLSKDLAPVQPLARARVFLVGLALVFLVSVALGSWLLGTNGWRQLGTVQKIAVLVPQSACAGLLASSLVRLMVPGSTHPISPTLLPVGVLSLLVVAIHLHILIAPRITFYCERDRLHANRSGICRSCCGRILVVTSVWSDSGAGADGRNGRRIGRPCRHGGAGYAVS